MKRYVKEFTADMLSEWKNESSFKLRTLAYNQVVMLCDYGYISNREAIEKIIEYERMTKEELKQYMIDNA